MRAYQRMEIRYTKASMRPVIFHQRSKAYTIQVPLRFIRAVRTIRVERESRYLKSDPSGSEDYVDWRRVCATTAYNQAKSNQDHRMSNEEDDRVDLRDHGERSKEFPHFRPIKHNDRDAEKINVPEVRPQTTTIGQVFLRVGGSWKSA